MGKGVDVKNLKPTTAKVEFNGLHFVGITTESINAWKTAYPAVDIQGEINRAAVWLAANPNNRKSNYPRFLANWFTRTQEKAPKQTNGRKLRSDGTYEPAL